MFATRLDLMLVDDEAADLAIFAKALTKSNFRIKLHALSAGQEAIDYLEAKGPYADRSLHPLPDVIVLDLKMPGLNGFDFLAWRKASPIFLNIPVVVLSGSNNQDDIQRVFQLGANKHLEKPSHFDDWKAVVADIYQFATEGTSFFRDESATTEGH